MLVYGSIWWELINRKQLVVLTAVQQELHQVMMSQLADDRNKLHPHLFPLLSQGVLILNFLFIRASWLFLSTTLAYGMEGRSSSRTHDFILVSFSLQLCCFGSVALRQDTQMECQHTTLPQRYLITQISNATPTKWYTHTGTINSYSQFDFAAFSWLLLRSSTLVLKMSFPSLSMWSSILIITCGHF